LLPVQWHARVIVSAGFERVQPFFVIRQTRSYYQEDVRKKSSDFTYSFRPAGAFTANKNGRRVGQNDCHTRYAAYVAAFAQETGRHPISDVVGETQQDNGRYEGSSCQGVFLSCRPGGFGTMESQCSTDAARCMFQKAHIFTELLIRALNNPFELSGLSIDNSPFTHCEHHVSEIIY
jgi:hypothetical protein